MASSSGSRTESSQESFPPQPHSKMVEVLSWSRRKKLKALSVHSKCESNSGCPCKGFKDQHSQVGKSFDSARNICQGCGHELSAHISDLETASDEDLNNLLRIVMDSNFLCSMLPTEEDSDTKQAYYAISKKLTKCVQERKKPNITLDHQESPPFEKPSIAEAISNFVEYKFSERPSAEYESMLDISKLFVKCLNVLKLMPVTKYQHDKTTEEINQYKVNYKRWCYFCYIPILCRSLQLHAPADIFGRTFLQSVYDANQCQLLNKIEANVDKAPVNRQLVIVTNCKTFLTILREEVFNSASPIWDLNFKQRSLNAESGDRMGDDDLNQNIEGDVPMNVVIEIMKTIKDPGKMIGPEHFTFFGMSASDQPIEEERSGILKCFVIGNSLKKKVSDQCLIWLIEFQKLISDNLSGIPKEYITRLLFDPKHRAIILLKNNDLIGGICFCVFPTQGFSEIVFCVVAKDQHISGYGKYMMNKLKDYHIKHNILHLLTYADNQAIVFFQKQGFTSDIKLEESRYLGYLKDYVHATFMHCELNPRIVYSKFSTVIQQQKEIVQKLIEMKQNKEPVVYPGLTFFKNGVREIPCDAIPGLKEAGFRPLKRQRTDLKPEELYQTLDNLLLQVKSHDYSWPFLKPIDESGAMIYRKHGKYPMDLHTMSERLQRRYYCSKHLFIADMRRIFTNCRSFNKPNSDYYKCADVLERFFQNKLKERGL